MKITKTYLLFLYCFFFLGIQAQDKKIDSMRAVVNSNVPDSIKIFTQVDIARSYRIDNAEQMLKEAQKALEMAESAGFKKGIAMANKWIGFYYNDRAEYNETLEYWNKSLAIFKEIKDPDGESNILNNIGTIYYNTSNNTKALEYFIPAFEIAEKNKLFERLGAAIGNIGLIYMEKPGTYPQALEYLQRGLKLAEEVGDIDNVGAISSNIAEIYVNMNQDSLALKYYLESMQAMEKTGHPNLVYTYTSVARLYQKKGSYQEMYNWLYKAYAKGKEINNPFLLAQTCIALGDYYSSVGDKVKAVEMYEKAQNYAKAGDAGIELKTAYQRLAKISAERGDFKGAYTFESVYSRMTDSLNAFQADSVRSEFQMGLKEKEITLANQQNKLKDVEIKRQKLVRNAFLVGFALVLTLIGILYRDYKNKIKTNKLLDQRKAEIEALLLNILPFEVAEELQKTGKSNPRFYESTTVMFTDFVGFSRIAETLTPQQVTAELNEFFTEMDEIIDRYGIEKIKTIGDSYMCAGGIPTPNTTHPIDVVRAGLDIVEYLRKKNKARQDAGLAQWEIRIGLNTGSLVAGVVGKKKYAYDIWGSAVNIASRMESNGSPGMLNISASTYELIKDKFECEYRGKIYAKNVGEIDMYFVKRELTNGDLKAHNEEAVSSEQ
jgi:adenylate cyclase